MCPQGVSVAFVGEEKQMGHVYADKGSLGGFFVVLPADCVGGESDMSTIIGDPGGSAFAFPFPFLSVWEFSWDEEPENRINESRELKFVAMTNLTSCPSVYFDSVRQWTE